MAKRFALILARSRYWDFYYVRFHIRLPFWETLPWGKTKLHRGNETVEFGTTEYNTFRLSKTTCCRLQSSNLLFVVPLSPPCKERYCWVFFCAPRDWYRIEWFFLLRLTTIKYRRSEIMMTRWAFVARLCCSSFHGFLKDNLESFRSQAETWCQPDFHSIPSETSLIYFYTSIWPFNITISDNKYPLSGINGVFFCLRNTSMAWW